MEKVFKGSVLIFLLEKSLEDLVCVCVYVCVCMFSSSVSYWTIWMGLYAWDFFFEMIVKKSFFFTHRHTHAHTHTYFFKYLSLIFS